MTFEEINYQVGVMLDSAEVLVQNIIGERYYNNIKRYALRHPFISAACITIAALSAIPLLLFLGFITTTLAIALVCFFCIEGSLIAISGLFFVGVVSFIAVVVGSILSGIAAAFYVLQKLGTCVNARMPCAPSDSDYHEHENSNEVEDTK